MTNKSTGHWKNRQAKVQHPRQHPHRLLLFGYRTCRLALTARAWIVGSIRDRQWNVPTSVLCFWVHDTEGRRGYHRCGRCRKPRLLEKLSNKHSQTMPRQTRELSTAHHHSRLRNSEQFVSMATVPVHRRNRIHLDCGMRPRSPETSEHGDEP